MKGFEVLRRFLIIEFRLDPRCSFLRSTWMQGLIRQFKTKQKVLFFIIFN
jgi:hypothetical protein